jgi:hypothetical protein
MSASLVAGLVVLVVVAFAVGALWRFRRRAIETERRRVATLTTLATRLQQVTASLEVPRAVAEPPPRPPAPLPPVEPGGRAAFLDALTDAVAQARSDGSRLTAAVVASDSTTSASLAGDVHGVTGGDAYEVGARAVALVVPGAGRADALGVLARIQAACGATGNAVELEPGDDAVALVTRLLSGHAESADGTPGEPPAD